MAPRPLHPHPHLLLAVTALLFHFPGAASDLAADGAALLAFRAAVGRLAVSWNSSSSPCSWSGVSCESGRVTVLRLPAVGLMGQIPGGTLGKLTALRTLSLRFNALSGAPPPDFAALSELRNLYLQGNRFSGEIPAAIFSLHNLVRLNLASNNFSGEISPALNNLTRLGTLYLESNSFSGDIPDVNLTALVQFNVSYNNLNGSIPRLLRKMPADAFIATGLCGGPLGPCPGEISPSPAEGPAGAPTSGVSGSSEGGQGKSSKKKLSGGAVAGIALGSAVGFLILLALLILLCRNSDGQRKTASLEAAAAAKPQEAAAAAAWERDKGLPDGRSPNGVRGADATMTPAAAAAAAAASAATGKKELVFFGRAAVAPAFDLEDLLRASAEVLGKGTFGTAYKALLENGAAVTVKRLKEVELAEGEFRERVDAVGRADHECVLPLKAYYYSKDEKLLVYDYMPIGSLSALLHGNKGSSRTPLNWDTRLAIALASARGVEYIHSTHTSTSHGNIKSSNILLDKSYQARVSDHGLAALVGPISSTTRASGYRAPEVTDIRRVSQKADVYSFGVLLLELLTGKAPAQALLNEEGVDLPRWVQSVVREEWTAEVFDMDLLRYQNAEEEMVLLLQLAVDCAAQHPDRRPTMSEVVGRIEEIRRSSAGDEVHGWQNMPESIDNGDDQSSLRTDSIR